MRLTIFILFAILVFASCSTSKKTSQAETITIQSAEEQDSTEYELIIMDVKYDSFLATQPSKEFYSNQYYRSWNLQYVTEWNIRYNNQLQYGDFYQTPIDYDAHIDYGIDLNYKLYNYFLFIEKEYGIKLVHRGKTAR